MLMKKKLKKKIDEINNIINVNTKKKFLRFLKKSI